MATLSRFSREKKDSVMEQANSDYQYEEPT
jgi:hypothetical protein